MHVSSDRDPVEIREGIVYYQVDEYFSYKGSSSMMRIYLLQVCAVRSGLVSVLRDQFIQVVALDPKETAQGNRRLGG